MPDGDREVPLRRSKELGKALGREESGQLEVKVSVQGAASVYGPGRFPVTPYHEQWVRLPDSADRLRAFLEDNMGILKLRVKQTHLRVGGRGPLASSPLAHDPVRHQHHDARQAKDDRPKGEPIHPDRNVGEEPSVAEDNRQSDEKGDG
jgi:hypothetical protein